MRVIVMNEHEEKGEMRMGRQYGKYVLAGQD